MLHRLSILSGEERVQKFVAQSNIDFLTLKENAYFTAMKEPVDDPFEEYANQSSYEFYQRRTDERRVKEIVTFLRSTILEAKDKITVPVIFPTAILLAFSYDAEDLKIDTDYDVQSLLLDGGKLYIVDGQHRLQSMIRLYDEVKDSYSEEDIFIKKYLSKFIFNCTVFINYDIWEQAQIFASVNFNQKKVSKSLYFSIYGMRMDPSMNEKNSAIYIAHQLVKYINTNKLSPLCQCIRMLGSGDGYVSQASIAEVLIPNIASTRGIWYVDLSGNNTNYRFMAIELISYLTVVRSLFDDIWPHGSKNHVSIICKTTGLGSILRLMSYIHEYLLSRGTIAEMKVMDKMGLCEHYIDEVTPLLKKIVPYRKKLFGLKEEGVYSGSGGKGLANNLFKDMIKIVRDEELPDYLLNIQDMLSEI